MGVGMGSWIDEIKVSAGIAGGFDEDAMTADAIAGRLTNR